MATADDVRFPSIDGLRAFEAAARLGSFERAADELAVTASAVSKRVATLEELLGTPLLQRGPKSLSLTAAGKEYLEHVRAALDVLAAAPLHRRRVQRAERLRVCAPPTFARQILVPQLDTFTAAHPAVELEVVLSIPFIGGEAPDADVEIRNGDLVAGALPLLDDVLVPMASPALLAKLPPLQRPADLAAAPLLRTPLEPWLPWFRAAGLDWPEPASGPRLVDLGLTLEAAVAGQGVALARPSLARHWLASRTLVPLFDVDARPAHRYFAVARGDGPAAAAFVRWLRDACAAVEREARAALQEARAALPEALSGRR
jgi:DNA-binding transcriptional LysR family regulator